MQERIKQSSELSSIPMSLIPNGLDANRFCLGNKNNARKELGLDIEATYVLLAANNSRERRKGFYEALKLLQLLKKNMRLSNLIASGKLRILLCGHDTEGVKVPDWQVDYAGYVDYNQMHVVYQSADLLLFTSLEDNLPNIVMEALACGLPVVGHELGGVRDLVGNDGDGGFLFPIGENAKACTFLERIILDKPTRILLGKNARNRVEKHFTIETQSQAYIELYSKQISKLSSHHPQEKVSSEEEFKILFDALYEKIKNCDTDPEINPLEISAHRIIMQSKWVRLGQLLGILHKS
jgi:glycosyltransferase involved in cell wall biosynthesis